MADDGRVQRFTYHPGGGNPDPGGGGGGGNPPGGGGTPTQGSISGEVTPRIDVHHRDVEVGAELERPDPVHQHGAVPSLSVSAGSGGGRIARRWDRLGRVVS